MSYPTIPPTATDTTAIHAPAASTTAIKAIAVADRINGMVVIDTSTQNQWIFASGSSAGASSSVLVPDVGTGRWLLDPSTLGVSAANAAQADADTALAQSGVYTATTAANLTVTTGNFTDVARVLIIANTSGGGADFTVTIPAASACSGKWFRIQNGAQGGDGVNVNLATADSGTIKGQASPGLVIGGGDSYYFTEIYSNGTEWM